LKITVLGSGTSQGIPIIGCNCNVCTSKNPKDKRLRSSVLIDTGKVVILVDAGPDFRQQMLRENVKRLDAIIFTHEHRDHIGGLDDIRAFNYINQAPMDVYAEDRVIKALTREYNYAFAEEKYPGVPKLTMHCINENPFEIAGTEITPIRLMHYNLPILGFRIGGFTYVTDANWIAESELQKMSKTEHLIINALRQFKHISHFSLSEAIDVARQCHAKKTYLTHLSDQMGLHDEINATLPENIFLSYDGMKIII